MKDCWRWDLWKKPSTVRVIFLVMVEYRLPDDVVRHLAFPRWLLASAACVAIYAIVFLLVPPSIAFHRDSGFLLTMGLTCIIWVCTYAIVIRHRFSSMRI